MQIIKASDLANYIFCRRVFWYSVNGSVPDNYDLMDDGLVYHRKIARRIKYSRITKIIALGLAVMGGLIFLLNLFIK